MPETHTNPQNIFELLLKNSEVLTGANFHTVYANTQKALNYLKRCRAKDIQPRIPPIQDLNLFNYWYYLITNQPDLPQSPIHLPKSTFVQDVRVITDPDKYIRGLCRPEGIIFINPNNNTIITYNNNIDFEALGTLVHELTHRFLCRDAREGLPEFLSEILADTGERLIIGIPHHLNIFTLTSSRLYPSRTSQSDTNQYARTEEALTIERYTRVLSELGVDLDEIAKILGFSTHIRRFSDRQNSSDIIRALKQKFIQLQTELSIDDPNILFEFAQTRAELRHQILTAISSS